MFHVVRRLYHGLTHVRCRAGGAVQPRMHHHVDDGPHAASFLANHDRVGAVELDLGGGVGMVSQLVLQPHELKAVP